MKIKTKLIWSYVIISLLVLFVTTVSLYSAKQIKECRDSIDKMDETIIELREMQYYFTGQANDERGFLLTGKAEYKTEIQQKAVQVKEIIKKLQPLMELQREKELLKLIDEGHTKFTNSTLKVLELYSMGKVQEAMDISFAEGRKYRKDLETAFAELTKIQQEENEESKKTEAHLTSQMTLMILISSLFVIVIGISFGIGLARNIVKPINKIALHMQSGDLNFAQMITNDEVGQLTKAFGDMVLKLRQMIGSVQASTEQLAASSQQLSASSEQAAHVSVQVASTIAGVAEGADQQLEVVTTAMEVVEQLSMHTQQIATHSIQVTASTEQTADAALAGGKAVALAIDKMTDIEKTVNHSATVVMELGHRSQEIGQIIDTIAGIAGQTNLLALNAAIEAARAGEQGRGFAVVAEEVRKLAEQSQEAAKQIAALIGTIQIDTGKAVSAMEDGTREVKAGSEVVNRAGVAFKEISSLVNTVSGQIKDITQAINQMAVGSQQIVNAVHSIDTISRDTSEKTQTVSAATQEQTATAEEIASASQMLARLAEQIQQAISQFKV